MFDFHFLQELKTIGALDTLNVFTVAQVSPIIQPGHPIFDAHEELANSFAGSIPPKKSSSVDSVTPFVENNTVKDEQVYHFFVVSIEEITTVNVGVGTRKVRHLPKKEGTDAIADMDIIPVGDVLITPNDMISAQTRNHALWAVIRGAHKISKKNNQGTKENTSGLIHRRSYADVAAAPA